MYKIHQVIGVIFILLTCLFLCILNIEQGHNWGGDFSLYIHQAKSIIQGDSSQLMHVNKFMVDNSSVHTFSPSLYPWGFPVLLAPVYVIFELNFFVLKVYESVLLILAILMMYLTFKSNKRLSFINGLFFILIIAFNLVYIKAINSVLSEIPFLLFSFLGLYLILRYLESPFKHSLGLAIIIGFVLFFSFSIRSEGIGLCFALFIGQCQYLLVNRRNGIIPSKKYLHFLIPYIIALTFYFILRSILPSGFTSHFSYQNLVNWDTSIENLLKYYDWIKHCFFGKFTIPYFIYFVFLLFLIGLCSRIKRDLIIISYFFFLVLLFTVWPFSEIRYMYSIYPFILYFSIQGIHFWLKKVIEISW